MMDEDNNTYMLEDEEVADSDVPERGRPAIREGRRNLGSTGRARKGPQRPDRDIEKNIKEKRGDFSRPKPFDRRLFSLPKTTLEAFKRRGLVPRFMNLDSQEISMHESEGWRKAKLSECPEFGASTLASSSSAYKDYQDCCISGDQILMVLPIDLFQEYQDYFNAEREKDNRIVRQALDNSENHLSPHPSMKNVRPIKLA